MNKITSFLSNKKFLLTFQFLAGCMLVYLVGAIGGHYDWAFYLLWSFVGVELLIAYFFREHVKKSFADISIKIEENKGSVLLFWMASCSFLGMLFGTFIARCLNDYSWAALFMFPSIGLGLLASMIEIEGAVEPVAKLSSVRLIGLALIASVTFIAHGEAVGKVNEIFFVDASSLPHATAIATVLYLVRPLSWVLLFLSGIKFVWTFVHVSSKRFNVAVVGSVATISWFMLAFIFGISSSEVNTNSLIYQFGVHYDFNLRSNCDGVGLGDGVLFIGPEQDRAIVVPDAKKIPGIELPLKTYPMPTKYKWVSCKSS